LFVSFNNNISTNVYGHFESFCFFNPKITLVARLEKTKKREKVTQILLEKSTHPVIRPGGG
jgi:hypothetical protein